MQWLLGTRYKNVMTMGINETMLFFRIVVAPDEGSLIHVALHRLCVFTDVEYVTGAGNWTAGPVCFTIVNRMTKIQWRHGVWRRRGHLWNWTVYCSSIFYVRLPLPILWHFSLHATRAANQWLTLLNSDKRPSRWDVTFLDIKYVNTRIFTLLATLIGAAPAPESLFYAATRVQSSPQMSHPEWRWGLWRWKCNADVCAPYSRRHKKAAMRNAHPMRYKWPL